MSNWAHDEKFKSTADVIITKIWEDYECGTRGWAKPDPSNKDLIKYLKRNAKLGSPDATSNDVHAWLDTNEYVIFWSEFDILK